MCFSHILCSFQGAQLGIRNSIQMLLTGLWLKRMTRAEPLVSTSSHTPLPHQSQHSSSQGQEEILTTNQINVNPSSLLFFFCCLLFMTSFCSGAEENYKGQSSNSQGVLENFLFIFVVVTTLYAPRQFLRCHCCFWHERLSCFCRTFDSALPLRFPILSFHKK